MDTTRNTGMPFGTALENAFAWGIPASPLFLIILMMLAHAPYASPIIEPVIFYLVCTLGTLVGFGLCAVLRSWKPRATQVLCWASAATLEASWLLMLWGEHHASQPAMVIGPFLVGFSTSMLLVLWLCVGQTPDVTCEICKLLVAFAAAFCFYSLFSVIPHAGAISYVFPAITCASLSFLLSKDRLDQNPVQPYRAGIAAASWPRVAATTLLLVVLGAGFAVLGFGGANVEQGAGLVTLALTFCLLLRGQKDILKVLRQLPMPLVVFALCYEFLVSVGNPFAFFLAACGTLVIWLYLAPRFDGEAILRIGPRRLAFLLLWIMLFAGAGIVAGQLILSVLAIPRSALLVFTIFLVVLIDFAWRIIVMVPPSHAPVPSIPSRELDSVDAQRLEQVFGLSPRETQVAVLLCENRSVNYVCASLGLTASTAKTHIRHIYEKTGVHSRTELQLLAERLEDGVPGNLP